MTIVMMTFQQSLPRASSSSACPEPRTYALPSHSYGSSCVCYVHSHTTPAPARNAMHFTQLAHLSETLYGGVFLCRDDAVVPATTDITHEPLVVVKLVNVRRAMAALDSSDAEHGSSGVRPRARSLDDPRQERAVAHLLRRTCGHPNIVQYHDVALVDGTLYFVMEFCARGDLHAFLSRTPRQIAPREALAIFAQIAAGLQFLHAHDVAHRDLSLENILLTADGVCKIADFGLSTRASKWCSDCVGKTYYMAPEVAALQSNDHDSALPVAYDPRAADLWSLGIVLFVLVTGSPLVLSSAPDDPAFRAFQTVGVIGVLDAWGVRSSLPDALCDLLDRLLQVTPSARLTVAQVLTHDALTRLCHGSHHDPHAMACREQHERADPAPLECTRQHQRAPLDVSLAP